MDQDYGLLAFDIPHRLVTSFIYELPIGEGRTFQPAGALGAIASGWSVNGILTLSDGRPFTVTTTDQAGTGPAAASRARTVSATPSPTDSTRRSIRGWIRPRSRRRRCGPYGNCANNTVRGPGSKSMNLSVFRSIALGATRRAEIRVETFNLFNWVNYGFPAANISNLGTFGRITSSVGDQREIQLAVKFYF